VLNPFTPFGDCSLVRAANLYANVCHVGTPAGMRECLDMVTRRSARLLRLSDYGVEAGRSADLVVLDCVDPAQGVAEVTAPLYGFKRGRPTFTRRSAELHRPTN
jgi:cytosine deaminase